ncbi:MAG: SEC-C metal-binding domain-containing protein [Pseudomonadota bacterium]
MLTEKLGRNDLCPCGSGRRFQEMLSAYRPL